jgi:hypothetical protein
MPIAPSDHKPLRLMEGEAVFSKSEVGGRKSEVFLELLVAFILTA